MEPLYEASGIMSSDRYERFFKMNMRVTHTRGIYIFFSICAGFLTVVTLFGGSLLPILLMLALTLFCAFLPTILVKGCVNQVKTTAKFQLDQPFTLRFFEDELIEFTPRSEAHLHYDEIYRVVESADMLLLYISATQAYVLFKTDMTRGEAAHLLYFLRFQKQIQYKYM